MGKDYYGILGVDKTASQDEIKKAFRKLAHQHHPDKDNGDEAKFKELNEAYQVIGKEDKRKQYDQYGSSFDQQGGFGGGMNWDDFMKGARQGGFQGQGQGQGQGQNFDMGDLNEIFGDIFGFGGGRRQQRKADAATRGRDVEMNIQVTFEEAIFGIEKEVEIYKDTVCDTCHGTGGHPEATEEQCAQCQGQGVIEQISRSFFGMVKSQAVCPECSGTGKKYSKICDTCSGNGRYKQNKKLTVKIPAGVDNGQTIRLSDEGEAGLKGGTNGDLFLHVLVEESSEFVRQGDDIISKSIISPARAALGVRKEIKTVEGIVELKIPAGTQSGKVFRLRNKGVVSLQGMGKGDHLVKVEVEIPNKLNRQQKKLYQELLDSE